MGKSRTCRQWVSSPDDDTVTVVGRVMKAQKTATKTQIYFQQKRKCKIDKTATRISRSATASVSVLYKEQKLVSNTNNAAL